MGSAGNSITSALASTRARVAFLAIGAVLLVCAAAATAAAPKPHNWPNSPVRHTLRQTVRATVPSFAANLRGGVAVAGNTVETCPQNQPNNEVCAGNSYNNNDQNMVYVNVDPGNGRFNSSSANLSIPSGAHVVKAFLYWAGDLSRGVTNGQGNRTGSAAPGGDTPAGQPPHTADRPHQDNDVYGIVRLRAGTGATYSTVNAFTQGAPQARWDSVSSWYSVAPSAGNPEGGSPGWAYQVRADVTDQLNNALLARKFRRRGANETMPITVANVQAGTGLNRYAGWNLIVVWETSSAAYRNITLFDGFAWVQVQGGQQLVVGPLDFSGFQTPNSGNVDAHVTVWATEGDRGITGDYLSLGNKSASCDSLTKQHDGTHPVDNFFNSTISKGGVDVGGRTPNFSNQLGFDLATLDVPEGTIGNNQTAASVCLGTTGDTYFFGGLVFDTLIKAPNLHISKVADHTTANPGDVVNYTTTVTNPSMRDPDDPLAGTPVNAATNLVVSDPLPSGLDFSGFTNNPGGACAYAAAARTINCDVGTLQPDATFTYSYNGTVSAAAQGDSPSSLANYACYDANSEDQPNVVFHGCDPATVVVPPAPPGPDPVDLGVVKTVSHNIVKPGATLTWTVVGTNYGPGTSTGFVLADQLPPGVQFVRASASPELTCTTPAVGSSGSVTCTAPTVPAAPAPGSSLTLTIVATVPPDTANGAILQNFATVSGDQSEPVPDPHPNRDETLTLVLVPDQPIPTPEPPPTPPDPDGPPQPPAPPVHPPNVPGGPADTLLRLTKTGSPASASLGDTITYALRVSNIGEALAMHIRVCDTPPAGLTVTSAPGFKRSGKSFCTTISRLAIGKRKTLHITARVTTRSAGRLVNHATVNSRNAPTRRTRAATIIAPSPAVTG
jgi:large repetitive protein